jgi:hypothetical protein
MARRTDSDNRTPSYREELDPDGRRPAHRVGGVQVLPPQRRIVAVHPPLSSSSLDPLAKSTWS